MIYKAGTIEFKGHTKKKQYGCCQGIVYIKYYKVLGTKMRDLMIKEDIYIAIVATLSQQK